MSRHDRITVVDNLWYANNAGLPRVFFWSSALLSCS